MRVATAVVNHAAATLAGAELVQRLVAPNLLAARVVVEAVEEGGGHGTRDNQLEQALLYLACHRPLAYNGNFAAPRARCLLGCFATGAAPAPGRYETRYLFYTMHKSHAREVRGTLAIALQRGLVGYSSTAAVPVALYALTGTD